ncbi:MAG: hypothetical protein R3C15_14610 [Thermoleophilia bacterium]
MSALQAGKPEGAPDLPAEALDALASSIANGTRPPAPPRRIGEGSFPAQSVLDAISGADAGTRIQELLQALEQANAASGYTDRGENRAAHAVARPRHARVAGLRRRRGGTRSGRC